MRNRTLFFVGLLALVPRPALSTIESDKARAFIGQDLYLAGKDVISCQPGAKEYVLVFQSGLSMSIGAHQFSSDKGVVWLESVRTESGRPKAQVRIDYRAIVYLEGSISATKAPGAKTTDLSQTDLEDSGAMVVRFNVTGEVFVTADKKEAADPQQLEGLELYQKAKSCVLRERAVIEKVVPEIPVEKVPPEKPAEIVPKPEEKKPRFRYPVNISPAGDVPFTIEAAKAPDGNDIATVIGRFYMSQKQDEAGGLLELQADNAVIFYSSQRFRADQNQVETSPQDILARGNITSVYLSGDVVMTEGLRSIRADEIYYDFEAKKALAINAEMRNFDVTEGVPIYVRAAKLKQEAKDRFAAENITLTTSEFYLPQISFNASQVIITDTTTTDQQKGAVSKGSYDAQMRDVRLKMYDTTIFYWPLLRSNLQRPDIPIKSAHIGHDNAFGTMLETQWYLARLLGLPEPEGTDNTLFLDYYSKRGVGTGIDVEYEREDYFGNIFGYIIDDSGEDRLGRHSTRKDLEPPRDLRGWFHWQHRQFLPYNWQLTTELAYLSDEHFLESYYRDKFYLEKEQETLVHLKRIEDNWGLSFLGKWRINDFADTLEELPTAEFHWTGQSLFDDKLTFYSDNQLSRLRQRLPSDSTSTLSQDFFTFGSTRNELDIPITIGKTKLVPFVAGTAGYEDGRGFWKDIDGLPEEREDDVLIGEAGIRASSQPYWKVFPGVQSRLWDLNQLRHIIRPYLTAVSFAESDTVAEQRDAINVGISQRLQTKRGIGTKERTVDWMRLDTDITWVDDSSDPPVAPDRFIWNKPFIPPFIRRQSNIYGIRRNSFCADYIWRISDTLAALSDMNFDMQSGVIQQFNVGLSHMRWPNLSYYIGSRYLRRVEVLDEKGSNAFTFAATYVIDPRYTLVFSQEFDFDYGANVRSDITLIRRYHRIFLGITYSTDESLDKHAITFSLWPEGVGELAFGPRRYMQLGPPAGWAGY